MVLDALAAMADAVWLYDPTAHRLLRHLHENIRADTGLQDFVGGAPLNLFSRGFSDDLPVVVEVIDTAEKLDGWLEALEGLR
jgi:hypothetical protein